MKVLVTGGMGFIGYHMVRKLVGLGHTVVVVDNLSGVGALERYRDEVNNLETPRLYNVTLPTSLQYGIPIMTGVDLVIHMAAVSRTVPAIEDPVMCMFTNVQGSVEVLEAARRFNVPRVVMSSSNVVYAADTPYKASKLMMEEACKAYHETYGVSVVCLRYSNVYGPGFAKGDPACLAAMRDSLVDKGYLEITGDGGQTRDFTHVNDIVAGNLAAAESEYCGTVDLCTGRNVSMNYAAVRLLAHRPADLSHTDPIIRRIEDRRGDCKHIIQDSTAAKNVLGWSAKVKFEDGVKDAWKY